MSRSDWGLIAAAIGVLVFAGAIALALYPEQPNLTGNTGYQTQAAGYRAGGPDCQPSEVDRLTGGDLSRRGINCKEAEEQHRLQTDDLMQQRRAADAADASAVFSFQQTRIGAIGAAFGLITMFAAIGAAWYARDAATAAKANLAHDRKVSDKELRPWISVKVKISLFDMNATNLKINYDAICTNIGQTPAYNVQVSGTLRHLTDETYIESVDEWHSFFRKQPHVSKHTVIPGDIATYSSTTQAMVASIPWSGVGIRECALCVIIISVSYNTAFDDDIHRSELSFVVGRKGPDFMDGRYLYRAMTRQKADAVSVSQFYSGEVS